MTPFFCGKTALEAIDAAVMKWQEENTYPKGQIKLEIPKIPGEISKPIIYLINTNGPSTFQIIAEVFEWIALAAIIVALIFMPVPGSRVAAAMMWTAIATSTTAAAMHIYDRHDRGVYNPHANVMDQLSVTKQPLVKKLEQYRWSSYPAYINKEKAPCWLHRNTVYEMLGQRQKYQGYKTYVMQGNETEIEQFYNRTNIPGALGESDFIAWLQDEIIPEMDDKTVVESILPSKLTIKQIIHSVARYYKLETKQLISVVKGPDKGLLARKIAMYLCQQLGGYHLFEIMESFELSNRGSVSFITSQIRRRCDDDKKLEKEIQDIKSCIIKNAT